MPLPIDPAAPMPAVGPPPPAAPAPESPPVPPVPEPPPIVPAIGGVVIGPPDPPRGGVVIGPPVPARGAVVPAAPEPPAPPLVGGVPTLPPLPPKIWPTSSATASPHPAAASIANRPSRQPVMVPLMCFSSRHHREPPAVPRRHRDPHSHTGRRP